MMLLRWLIVAVAVTAAVILVAAAMRRQGWSATDLRSGNAAELATITVEASAEESEEVDAELDSVPAGA